MTDKSHQVYASCERGKLFKNHSNLYLFYVLLFFFLGIGLPGGTGKPSFRMCSGTVGGPTHHYLEMARYFVICFAQLIRPLLLLFLMKTQLQQK